MKNYLRFGVMILVSTVVMYVLMYLNTYSFDHIFNSQTRIFMAILMGSVMAFVMLLFMWKMYSNKKVNYLILVASALIFIGSLYMVRSQTAVNDVRWMKAMIPHHSIAIMTSKRANIKDPEVKKLANEIITAQEEEIGRMKKMIKRLENEK